MLNLLSYIINIYLTLQIIAADRNIKLVSSEQGNLSEYSKSTDKCPDSYGAFGANFYSGFTCTATHPTTISSTYAVFDISSLPPHFRRDLRVEIFLVKYSSVKISFKLDSLTAVTLSPDVNSDIRLNLPCKRTSTDAGEKDSDFYINWNQNTTTLPANNAYTIFSIIDLTSTSGTSYARIKAIQYNVEQCDNSCLSCNGSLATSCTSCDTTCSLLSSGACILNQSGYVLQEGKCVSSCTSPHFNLNGKCIWIPNCSALTSGSYCTTCISGFVPVQTSNYEAQCQAYCPNDYETVNGVCLDKKRTMIGAYLLQGLFSYTFSGYEIEKMSLTLTNFASVNNFSSIFSRCGNYQILGGFFSYRNNSQISSQQYTTTYQYVRVSFKWVLIDYNSTSTPNVQISVTSSSTTYQTISLTGTSKAQLCGLGLEEYVGNFQYDYLVPSGKVVVNILNKMTAIQSNITDITDANDQRNKYQYLGIRELQIYAFNVKLCFSFKYFISQNQSFKKFYFGGRE